MSTPTRAICQFQPVRFAGVNHVVFHFWSSIFTAPDSHYTDTHRIIIQPVPCKKELNYSVACGRISLRDVEVSPFSVLPAVKRRGGRYDFI